MFGLWLFSRIRDHGGNDIVVFLYSRMRGTTAPVAIGEAATELGPEVILAEAADGATAVAGVSGTHGAIKCFNSNFKFRGSTRVRSVSVGVAEPTGTSASTASICFRTYLLMLACESPKPS